MDFDFDPCSVCNNEDGLYCCKICNLKYCADHLCLHLNVAWESNTWTRRNDDDIQSYEGITSRLSIESELVCSGESDNSRREMPILGNAKTLLAYTEEELEAQFEFYNAQARRIRRELERRSVSLSGIPTSESKYAFQAAKRSKTRTPTRKNASKSTTRAFQLVADQLRAGNISIQYLKSKLL